MAVTLYKDVASFDEVREEAARCCDETARHQRGERGPLRTPDRSSDPEFCDAALGVAAEVADVVAATLRRARQRFTADFVWSTAAMLLRNGWQRGHKLVPHVVGRGAQG